MSARQMGQVSSAPSSPQRAQQHRCLQGRNTTHFASVMHTQQSSEAEAEADGVEGAEAEGAALGVEGPAVPVPVPVLAAAEEDEEERGGVVAPALMAAATAGSVRNDAAAEAELAEARLGTLCEWERSEPPAAASSERIVRL